LSEGDVGAPSCKDVIIKIGQYTYLMSYFRRQLISMLRDLYGDYLMRYHFGHHVSLPEALMQLQFDLQDGKFQVRGTKLCNKERCINLEKFLKLLDEYYNAHREKLRMERALDWCSTEVEGEFE